MKSIAIVDPYNLTDATGPELGLHGLLVKQVSHSTNLDGKYFPSLEEL